MDFLFPSPPFSDSPTMSQRNSAGEGAAQALLLGLFTGKKMLTPHDAASGLSVKPLSHLKDLPLAMHRNL